MFSAKNLTRGVLRLASSVAFTGLVLTGAKAQEPAQPDTIIVNCPITYKDLHCIDNQPAAHFYVCVDGPNGTIAGVTEIFMPLADIENNMTLLGTSAQHSPAEIAAGMAQLQAGKDAVEQGRRDNTCKFQGF